SAQTPFLFLDPKKNYIKTIGYVKAREACKQSNSHGACLEMFDGLKKMMLDLRVIPDQCHEKIGELDEVRTALLGSLELMARMAWGNKAPASVYEKVGWYDSSHLHMYCALKAFSLEFYGQESWSEFVNKVMPQLPQYSELTTTEAWPRTLFSLNCD